MIVIKRQLFKTYFKKRWWDFRKIPYERVPFWYGVISWELFLNGLH
ncbi:hypothetical protein hp908_0119 [Helicobacter pylori 908]|nr:hypothetical protein hp908_0119 [Helicobacter pylori 908]ADZ49194.1 hypothetical protein hp2017_0115 [Helicobacter pylori 2017]ADZ50792.1 hypothetical protein hp2018_0118 [Helicobacter pylori 2018]